ncbi:MAG: hypothetical protein AB1806_15340 [Acidobacteriota bacterium]
MWKGQVVVIDYSTNGTWRNINNVREVGEAVTDSRQRLQERQPVHLMEVGRREGEPVAVMNYLTERGWQQAIVTPDDNERIQAEVGKRTEELTAECLLEAKRLLADLGVGNAVTPKNVLDLGMFLAERRIVHISKVYQEHLKAKVERERQASPGPVERGSCEALLSTNHHGGDTCGMLH